MEFLKGLISHKLTIIALCSFVTLMLFLSKNYLMPVYATISEIPKKVKNKLQSISNNKTSKKMVKEYGKLAKNDQIILNIKNQIINLNSGDNSKIQTSIVQLLEYPSPDGCIAIVKFATELSESQARAELVCQLCSSLTTYSDDWYK